MTTEEWRAVPGYEGRYEASDQGRVRSLRFRDGRCDVLRKRPLVLRLEMHRTGYWRVRLSGHDRHQVHRLVLSAFVGPCPQGMEAAHLNGKRADNRPENLAWVTRAENAYHRVLHGTALVGDRHPNHVHPERVARGESVGTSKVTEQAVREIRLAWAKGETQRSIGARYGLTEDGVRKIVHRTNWRHVA